MAIDEYVKCIMTKIFTNQESMRHKYSRFVKVFECIHYEGLNCMGLKTNITSDQLKYIVDDVTRQLDDFLANHMLAPPSN
jgi:5'(3')-deoxyribonucleotidase